MKKIKNFVILSLVSFLLGGTIYFSLTVQDQPQDEPAVKGVETARPQDDILDKNPNSDAKTLAYVNPPGIEVEKTTPSPTAVPKGGITSATVVPTYSSLSPTKPMSPTPTFGTKYENTNVNSLPTQVPLSQTNPNPVVTLPVAGFGDNLTKMVAGAGFLIIASFLL